MDALVQELVGYGLTLGFGLGGMAFVSGYGFSVLLGLFNYLTR